MTTTTTIKEQNWKKQHFFSWDGVVPRLGGSELCFCGHKREDMLKDNYPLHFPEIEKEKVTVDEETKWLVNYIVGCFEHKQFEEADKYTQWYIDKKIKEAKESVIDKIEEVIGKDDVHQDIANDEEMQSWHDTWVLHRNKLRAEQRQRLKEGKV